MTLDDEYYTYYDLHEFQKLMEEATAKLKRMNTMSRAMRWQIGEPKYYTEFVEEMNEANGWISSHC
jgi:hypothetical protein